MRWQLIHTSHFNRYICLSLQLSYQPIMQVWAKIFSYCSHQPSQRVILVQTDSSKTIEKWKKATSVHTVASDPCSWLTGMELMWSSAVVAPLPQYSMCCAFWNAFLLTTVVKRFFFFFLQPFYNFIYCRLPIVFIFILINIIGLFFIPIYFIL